MLDGRCLCCVGGMVLVGCRLRCVSGAALIERCLFCVIGAACCFFVGDGGVVVFRRGGAVTVALRCCLVVMFGRGGVFAFR